MYIICRARSKLPRMTHKPTKATVIKAMAMCMPISTSVTSTPMTSAVKPRSLITPPLLLAQPTAQQHRHLEQICQARHRRTDHHQGAERPAGNHVETTDAVELVALPRLHQLRPGHVGQQCEDDAT